jgi:hypothetical protein
VLVVRAVLAAVVLALIAAGGASGHVDRSSANSTSFTDPVGDSGAKPDITGVTVSNDDAGKLTFTVTFANRPALIPGDFVEIFVDADNAAWTGNEGFEYVIEYSLDSNPPTMELDRWNGTQYSTDPAPMKGSYAAGTLTLELSFRALDDTAKLRFFVYSDSGANEGDTDFDDAPAGSYFPYQVKVPLLLDAFKAPGKVKAGKSATAALTVTTDDDVHGSETCRGTIGGKSVRGQGSWVGVRIVPRPSPAGDTASPFAYKGVVFCTWKVPKTTKRTLLKGTIRATKEGLTVSRSFSVRVGYGFGRSSLAIPG